MMLIWRVEWLGEKTNIDRNIEQPPLLPPSLCSPQVFVNGRLFHLFRHRMPVEQVSALKVAGDITVPTFNMIRVRRSSMHPKI